jgi:EAL domain-containing protein (putative c-di-GMP-specific phosphodiesterase class I)
LNTVTYSKEKDPKFYIFLERLEKAAEFKELDRINARTALDDFVTGKKSIQYLKIVR